LGGSGDGGHGDEGGDECFCFHGFGIVSL
jgi:hypothetical protein